MKVHELITILKEFDQNLDVYVPSKLTDFDFCKSNSVSAKFLTIEKSEDYPDETIALVIDET
jgi:hypothetical protein